MAIFNSYVKLPEGKPPFSYGFPMVFPWFSVGEATGETTVAVAAVALLGATTPRWVAAGQLHQAPGLAGLRGAVGACHQAITSQQLTSN